MTAAINPDDLAEPSCWSATIERQAVVLIHGIGSQRPMQTLRAFVEGLIRGISSGSQPSLPSSSGTVEEIQKRYFSKPDRFETTGELRRLFVPCNEATRDPFGVDTDFYEFYWAYLMKGTTWRHLVGWFKALLLRLPVSLGPFYSILWAVGWLVVLLTGWLLLNVDDISSLASTPAWVLAVVVLGYVGLGLSVIGDAARYLSNAPANIEVRRDIRDAGIELLASLNRDPAARYDRVVVVGHSLGSVIAYDILSHLWQREHVPPSRPAEGQVSSNRDLMDQMEQHAEMDACDVGLWRRSQRDLSRQGDRLGVRWNITDLVTVGSPLAHARWLIAGSKKELERLRSHRELPTSPPEKSDPRDKRLTRQPIDDDGRPTGQLMRVLHHGAVYACTRWTNFYFSWWRDPVGGPVRDLGWGIDNVPALRESWLRWRPLPLVAHFQYWRQPTVTARLGSIIDTRRSQLDARPERPPQQR